MRRLVYNVALCVVGVGVGCALVVLMLAAAVPMPGVQGGAQ